MKEKIFDKKNLYYVFLFVVVVFLSLVGLNSSPLNKGITQNDSAVFQIMGKGMLDGQVIYKDLFDHKGPIMYIINAIAYLISPKIGLFVVEIVLIYIGALFIFKTSKIFVNEKISFIMALFYLMLFFLYSWGGNFTEEYAITFVSIALFCIEKIIYEKKNDNKLLWIIIGLTFALTFFIKPTYIAVWIAFGFAYLIYTIKENKIKELIKYIIYMLIGILIVSVPIFIYLIVTEDISDFIKSFFIMNMKYSTSTLSEKKNAFLNLICNYKYFDFLVIGLISNVFILIDKNIKYENKIFITFFFIVSGVLTCWAPRTYKHYLMQLAPTITFELIMFVFLVSTLKLKDKEKELLKQIPVNIIYSFVIIYLIFTTSILISNELGVCSVVAKNGPIIAEMLNEVKAQLGKEDEMIVLGNEPYYYIYLEKQPKFKYFFQIPIILFDKDIQKETQDYIVKEKPKVIIKDFTSYDEPDFVNLYGNEVENFIKQEYQEYDVGRFKYYIKNSDI